jgi:hypothetical protein
MDFTNDHTNLRNPKPEQLAQVVRTFYNQVIEAEESQEPEDRLGPEQKLWDFITKYKAYVNEEVCGCDLEHDLTVMAGNDLAHHYGPILSKPEGWI